ncbi:protein-L-isoaspartate(D-aspartate) O-methyltransferase [bacterium]|nr:protein-L-isoaspartate(D-aspartate) O-methyltransferase [bacterium]MBU1153942.1 protein-L-isoaspartate(D-aspartate) O-methyltransferase [bacterium]MBU1782223.1 protein-L-isoaspartate(D-aspartate) O-methyltransferase [bacterium]
MNLKEKRELMVKNQIVARGIKDPKVIKAILKVERHKFVDEYMQDKAYEDYPLPVGFDQTISQPYMVALMTQCLELKGDEKVLEVGTGSGYQAAILAEICEKVYSIERVANLATRASNLIINDLNYTNVLITVGDGTCGLPQYAPYDRIIVTAASPNIPKFLIEQLSNNGLMVIPIGGSFLQNLTIIRKRDKKIQTQESIGCVFVPLIGKYGWENNKNGV